MTASSVDTAELPRVPRQGTPAKVFARPAAARPPVPVDDMPAGTHAVPAGLLDLALPPLAAPEPSPVLDLASALAHPATLAPPVAVTPTFALGPPPALEAELLAPAPGPLLDLPPVPPVQAIPMPARPPVPMGRRELREARRHERRRRRLYALLGLSVLGLTLGLAVVVLSVVR